MRRTTIKDIAQLVGVNPSTISRALHDHQDISSELREKIKEVAQQLNYTPNLAAINLKNKSSKLIGLIVPHISMHFFPSVIQGITTELNKEGYKLMILSSEEELEKEIENIKICCQSSVDGILISLSNQTSNVNHFDIVEELGISVIIIDKTVEQNAYDEIIIDDYKTGQSCATFFIERNCKDIIGVFGNIHLSITQKRLEGFRDELSKHKKIKFEIIHANTTLEAHEKLKSSVRKSTDAVFAMSDELMLGVNSALFETKLNSIARLAISDGKLPHFMTPEISYIKHSGHELGKEAAIKLLQKIQLKEHHSPQETILLQTELVSKLD